MGLCARCEDSLRPVVLLMLGAAIVRFSRKTMGTSDPHRAIVRLRGCKIGFGRLLQGESPYEFRSAGCAATLLSFSSYP